MTGGSRVIGYVDGRPVPRCLLDRRIAALRQGPRAAALPAPGSSEDRQLIRWLAQVVLITALCEAEIAARRIAVITDPDQLDQQAATELGSITAAAYHTSAAVRAVYRAVTATTAPDDGQLHQLWRSTSRPLPARWTIDYSLDAGPAQRLDAALDELPRALADALSEARPGAVIEVVDGLGTHRASVLAVRPACEPDFARDAPALRARLRAAAGRRAFAHWLDHARANRVRLVAGLEHPGDPRQPDNHHRH